MIQLSAQKTEGIQTQPLGVETAGKIISFEGEQAVAYEHETVFAAIRLGLHFAANASRVFWPSTAKQSALDRGGRLRKLCGLPEDHAIKTRNARNRFEHLDEWLDDWTDPSPRPYLMVEGIILPHYADQTREQIHEGPCIVYDTQTKSVMLFGKSFALADMIEDLKDLQRYTGQGTAEIIKTWK